MFHHWVVPVSPWQIGNTSSLRGPHSSSLLGDPWVLSHHMRYITPFSFFFLFSLSLNLRNDVVFMLNLPQPKESEWKHNPHISLPLTKAFPDLRALSLLSLTFADTSGSWVTETLPPLGAHRSSWQLLCQLLQLAEDFLGVPLRGNSDTALCWPSVGIFPHCLSEPPHRYHPRKCLNELSVMPAHNVLLSSCCLEN